MMASFDPSWALLLLEASLKGSLVLLAAFGVTRAMRRAPAAARHLVWTLALGGMLLIPAVSYLLPAWRVPVLPATTTSPAAEHAAIPTPPADVMFSEPIASTAAGTEVRSTAESPARSVAEESASIDWRAWLLGLWMLGGAMVLFRILAGVAMISWLERRATMMTDAGWLGLAHALAQRLGLHRGVTLLRGDRESVPMTWGVLQPIIWLPAASEGWSPERRRVVLAHELAHVRRRDALTQWIAHVVLALHWFNPLVWMAIRRQREERERACDDAVLGAGACPSEYADHLLDMVRSLGSAGGLVPAMAMARRSQFEGRLLAILDGATRRGGVSRATTLCIILTATAAMVPVAALRATSAPAAAMVTLTPDEARQLESLHVRTDGEGAKSDARGEESGEPPADLEPDTPQVAQRTGTSSGSRLIALAAEMSSDSYKSDFLVKAADVSSDDPVALAEIVRAATTISSSSLRARVLAAVLKQPALTPAIVLGVLRATAGVSASAEKSEILRTVAARQPLTDPALRAAFLTVADSITSSSDRTAVLTGLLRRHRLSEAELVDVLRSTGGISSSSAKQSVLTLIARRYPIEGRVRDAYLAAVGTLSSDASRAATLSAVISPSELDQTEAHEIVREGQGEWTTSIHLTGSHNGEPAFELTIRGEGVVLTPDHSDVAEIRDGGFLTVEHTRFPGSPDPDPLVPEGSRETLVRSLRITPAPGGELHREYRVNNQVRPFGAEGRAWLATILRDTYNR